MDTRLDEMLPRWRERLAAWEGTPEAETHAGHGRSRDQHRASLVALFDAFGAGELDLDAFREAFDHGTRGDWESFGLKGASGAMFVNMLVRNVPDREGVADALRAALSLPADATEAEVRIRRFVDWLEAGIDAGDFTRGQVHPRRAATFLSTCWAARDPAWPAYWRSAIAVFDADGLCHQTGDRAASYAAFHRVYTGLMGALGVSALTIEAVCAWAEPRLDGPAAASTPPPTPVPAPVQARAPGRSVWLISPGERARLWSQWQEQGIAAIGWDYLGDLTAYPTREDLARRISEARGGGSRPTNDVNACWDFRFRVKPGDILIAKQGRRRIVGVGVVTGEYQHQPQRPEYHHVRPVDWFLRGAWSTRDEHLVTKTLTDISGYPAFILRLEGYVGERFATDPDEGGTEPRGDGDPPAAFTLEDAAADLFLGQDELAEMLALLERRRNLVLSGPPGSGKTLVARRLARLLTGPDAPEQLERVQFHQSMSYEDFVQGFRPTDAGGFVRRDGPFLRFCHRALQDPESPYVLLIDEINRGNLSRILGELMQLVEPDKRSKEWGLTLTYAREDEPPFYVPDKLYIIGTMNTADRSLALVDYALRRRFAFVEVPSAVHTPSFRAWLVARGLAPDLADALVSALTELNKRIRADPDLGAGFCVGHSYFCAVPSAPDAGWLQQVLKTEVLPLLREYWVDAPASYRSAEELLDIGD